MDRQHGGFFSTLDEDLQPRAREPKRLRVQARQIWVFAAAALDGAGEDMLDTALAGHAFLDRFRDRRHGGWYRTASAAGEPLDRTKDCYDHAFVVLALATLFRATGQRELLAEALHTVELLDRHLADPESGGYLEGADEDWTSTPGPRRQNPHMHLFEALLALFEASDEAHALERATAILALLRTRFLEPGAGSLREHFGRDWQPAPGPDGRIVEPGHHFEWSWLLAEYARLARDESVHAEADALFDFAARHGLDSEHGGVFDQIDAGGSVLLDTKRLWPQTEYLHALASRALRGLPDASPPLRAQLELCLSRYRDPRHAGWREQADRSGRITSSLMHATSVYHVQGALRAVAGVPGGAGR